MNWFGALSRFPLTITANKAKENLCIVLSQEKRVVKLYLVLLT